MNISNEALEAAINAFALPRADRTPHIREQYEKKIRAALEAAAPHLAQSAFDAGYRKACEDIIAAKPTSGPTPYQKPTHAP